MSRSDPTTNDPAKADKDPRTHAIIGAAMEVHRQLGPGFLEAVYQQALQVEFAERKITFSSQIDLPVQYKGKPLNCTYRADLICFDGIVVELKAIAKADLNRRSANHQLPQGKRILHWFAAEF